jgi:hypothetical protein
MKTRAAPRSPSRKRILRDVIAGVTKFYEIARAIRNAAAAATPPISIV